MHELILRISTKKVVFATVNQYFGHWCGYSRKLEEGITAIVMARKHKQKYRFLSAVSPEQHVNVSFNGFGPPFYGKGVAGFAD